MQEGPARRVELCSEVKESGLFLPQHNLAALYTLDLNLPFSGLTSFFLPSDNC